MRDAQIGAVMKSITRFFGIFDRKAVQEAPSATEPQPQQPANPVRQHLADEVAKCERGSAIRVYTMELLAMLTGEEVFEASRRGESALVYRAAGLDLAALCRAEERGFQVALSAQRLLAFEVEGEFEDFPLEPSLLLESGRRIAVYVVDGIGALNPKARARLIQAMCAQLGTRVKSIPVPGFSDGRILCRLEAYTKVYAVNQLATAFEVEDEVEMTTPADALAYIQRNFALETSSVQVLQHIRKGLLEEGFDLSVVGTIVADHIQGNTSWRESTIRSGLGMPAHSKEP